MLATRRLGWALVISGPLIVVGLLYLGSCRAFRRAALVVTFAAPATAALLQLFSGGSILPI